MLRSIFFFSFIILLIFGGCATKPEEIRATSISPLKYRNYDCDQIIDEMDYVSTSSKELFESLKKRHDNDSIKMGVGLVLFWPTLFFLSGDNEVENIQYANLKGEYEALRKAINMKKCSYDMELPKSPDEIMKEYQEEAEKKKQEKALKDKENNL